jgi:hypothetical protein
MSACFNTLHPFIIFHQLPLLLNQSSTTQLPIIKPTAVTMNQPPCQANGYVDYASQNAKYPGRGEKENFEDVPYDGITNFFEPVPLTRKREQGWQLTTNVGRGLAESGTIGSHDNNTVTKDSIQVWKDEKTGDKHWRSLVVKDGKRYQIHWYYVDCGPRWCGEINEQGNCSH